MPVPTKDQIADLLESIAQMLELKGENIFKIRAYTNAARAIETYSGDLATAAAENRLGDIHESGTTRWLQRSRNQPSFIRSQQLFG